MKGNEAEPAATGYGPKARIKPIIQGDYNT